MRRDGLLEGVELDQDAAFGDSGVMRHDPTATDEDPTATDEDPTATDEDPTATALTAGAAGLL